MRTRYVATQPDSRGCFVRSDDMHPIHHQHAPHAHRSPQQMDKLIVPAGEPNEGRFSTIQEVCAKLQAAQKTSYDVVRISFEVCMSIHVDVRVQQGRCLSAMHVLLVHITDSVPGDARGVEPGRRLGRHHRLDLHVVRVFSRLASQSPNGRRASGRRLPSDLRTSTHPRLSRNQTGASRRTPTRRLRRRCGY